MNARTLRNVWRLARSRCPGTIDSDILRKIRPPVVNTISVLYINPIFKTYTTKAAPRLNVNPSETYSKLESEYMTHGNVHPRSFQNVLEALEAGGNLTPEQSVFMLEACVDLMPSQTTSFRMKLFTTFWDHLRAVVGLQKQHFIIYLKVHTANGIPITDFRKFLRESGMEGDSDVYEELIRNACEFGDLQTVREILADMRKHNLTLKENIFNALIWGHSRGKDLNGARTILDTMTAAGINPSATTYGQLIGAYIEHMELTKASALIQEYYGQLHTNQIVSLIKISAFNPQEGIESVLQSLIQQLPVEYLTGKEVAPPIRNLCTNLIYNGRLEEAYQVIKALPNPKFNDNQDTDTFGVSFLQDLLRCRISHQKIIEIAKRLVDDVKNTRALHVACECAMRRNPESAELYLKALSKVEQLRPHYFWPIILHRFADTGEAGVLKTLKEMASLNVSVDYETMSKYVLTRLSLSLDNSTSAIKILEDCGLKPSEILTPTIAHFIFQQKLDDVLKISNLYLSKFDTNKFVTPLANIAPSIRATRRTVIYSKVIHALSKKGENQKIDFIGQLLLEIINNDKGQREKPLITRLLQDLNKLGAHISPVTADILRDYFANSKKEEQADESLLKAIGAMCDRNLALPATGTSASLIKHPRDMSYEELENHLIELESKKMNTRGVLRRLLQICVREGHLDRALEIKKKCEEANVTVSPGMLASIFDMYIKLEDLHSAEKSLKLLLKSFPGFLLDEHKVIDYAALMVQHGHINEAKTLLRDRATTRKVLGGDYVIKNVWKLLTNVARVAAEKPDLLLNDNKNLTKEFFFFIRNLGYCQSQNTVLGPIIRECLNRNDVKSAVNEFKNLADTFRHTPLQFELMSLLVHLSSSKDTNKYNVTQEDAKNLLQEVITVVSNVHGVVNMNSSLLLSVAESGTENQLRKLIMNPEFRINQGNLKQNCEHLNKEGCVNTLLKLGKACRGLGHLINEQEVYNMLLTKFFDDNNYSSALKLYETLEGDDELKISPEFAKNLTKLLQINKIQLPNSLALRAQLI